MGIRIQTSVRMRVLVVVYGSRVMTKWIQATVRIGVPVVVYGCRWTI